VDDYFLNRSSNSYDNLFRVDFMTKYECGYNPMTECKHETLGDGYYTHPEREIKRRCIHCGKSVEAKK